MDLQLIKVFYSIILLKLIIKKINLASVINNIYLATICIKLRYTVNPKHHITIFIFHVNRLVVEKTYLKNRNIIDCMR